MKKRILLLVVFWSIAFFGLAQVALQGKLTNEKGEPLRGATIELKSKSATQSTATNEQGEFSFSTLLKGVYTLSAGHVGYETYSQFITLGESNSIQVQLIQRTAQLQNVEIVGRTAKKYNSDYSFGATKTATLNKDIPQAISTITKELMADRQACQLAEAVKTTSGVIPSSYYNQYAIRGISQNEEGQIINGMRTRQHYFLQPLTTNIERVEVIKGPASATFASVDPGGCINLVTKKPLPVDRKEISISAGSFSTIRGTLDFTGPLNESKTLLYRINGAYQEARSYRDLVGNRSLLISPSFSYIPNDRTAINAEMILSNMTGNLDRGQPIFGAVAGE